MVEEHRYLISDASRIVEVEAHVLRYWEEELNLTIGRTELGHRYYTKENIELFQKVKKLKEKGLQLKAIKNLLDGNDDLLQNCHIAENLDSEGREETKGEEQETCNEKVQELMVLQKNTEKLKQFEKLVEEILERVVRENNDELEKRIGNVFSREMDCLLYEQERQQEERFRKLDEAIREHQRAGRQAAATKEMGFLRRWIHKKKSS